MAGSGREEGDRARATPRHETRGTNSPRSLCPVPQFDLGVTPWRIGPPSPTMRVCAAVAQCDFQQRRDDLENSSSPAAAEFGDVAKTCLG